MNYWRETLGEVKFRFNLATLDKNNQNKTSSDNNKSSGKDKGQKGGGKKK